MHWCRDDDGDYAPMPAETESTTMTLKITLLKVVVVMGVVVMTTTTTTTMTTLMKAVTAMNTVHCNDGNVADKDER